MASKRKPPKYAMAYDCVMEHPDITPAEKLVLIEIGRYWPSPWTGSNETIASNIGLSVSYVKRLIHSLFEKKIIRRGLTTITRHGKPYTSRVMIISLLPKYSLKERTLWYPCKVHYSIPTEDTIVAPNKEREEERKGKVISFRRSTRKSTDETLNTEKSLKGEIAAGRVQEELKKLGLLA